MTPLEQAQAALDAAARQMADAVREAWPVGMQVKIDGRGRNAYTIYGYPPLWHNTCADVQVLSSRGTVSRVHYSQLRKVDPKASSQQRISERLQRETELDSDRPY